MRPEIQNARLIRGIVGDWVHSCQVWGVALDWRKRALRSLHFIGRSNFPSQASSYQDALKILLPAVQDRSVWKARASGHVKTCTAMTSCKEREKSISFSGPRSRSSSASPPKRRLLSLHVSKRPWFGVPSPCVSIALASIWYTPA